MSIPAWKGTSVSDIAKVREMRDEIGRLNFVLNRALTKVHKIEADLIELLEGMEDDERIDYSTLEAAEPIITVKGEIATLIDQFIHTNPELFRRVIKATLDEQHDDFVYRLTADGQTVQDADATPVGSDQQPEQREDTVGQRWGREVTYGSGLLPDEGGTG